MKTGKLLGSLAEEIGSQEFSLADEILDSHSGDKWFASARPEAVARQVSGRPMP